MKSRTLIQRSLCHYWRTHFAVLAGVMAATAVIGGALLVGDSVRDSLRQMSVDRLGGVDHALVAPRFFRQQLADDLQVAGQRTVAAAIVLQAGVTRDAGGDIQRAAGVAVYGMEAALWTIWSTEGLLGDLGPPAADEVVLNRRTAEAVGATVGDEVSLLIEIPAAIPRDALLGERNETVTALPLRVSGIAEDELTPGRFGLNPAQQLPLNAFVNLATLQRQLGMQHVPASRRNPTEKPARINALFVDDGETTADQLTQTLDGRLTLPDLSLRIVTQEDEGYVSLESEQMILEEAVGEAVGEVAAEWELTISPVLVYLLNEIQNATDAEKFSMYSIVAGIDFDKPAPFGPLEFTQGGPPLHPGEVVINDWLAADLGITRAGEQVAVTHTVVGDRGELPDVGRTWTVSGIVKLDGPAADPHYTPFVEGITDADTFGDWRQPYPMDLDRVTDRDEEYWDEHRTTPKLLLPLDAAQELFASRYGRLTSVRLAPREAQALPRLATELEPQLLGRLIEQNATGLRFNPVREQGLAAASGTTDFTGLFIGFSFFLIAAALLLIGLLVRLGLERRVSELGLLSAVGLAPNAVRRLFLAEISLIVWLGGLLGALAAIGYAGLMIHGLKTWWFGAIGTRFLFLSVQPVSLLSGFFIAVVMSLLTCWWTLWRMRGVSTRQMLAGVSDAPLQAAAQRTRGRRSRTTALCAGGIAGVFLLATIGGVIPSTEAFAGFQWPVVTYFTIGIALLVASLSLLAWQLDEAETAESSRAGVTNLVLLGLRNAARHRERSVLTTCLIAAATFVIVSVAAGRRNPAAEEPVRDSGNGGFTLLAEASTPLLYDLNTKQGRADAGFDVDDTADRLLSGTRVMPFRVRPGEDASCLNLYQTHLPRILGVPEDVLQAMIDEHRFRFANTPDQHPWSVLNRQPPDGRVPVLGDMNTLMYSLHKGIGDTLEIPADEGPGGRVEVAGMFDASIFQGMLLMSEANFHRLFPDRAGFAYFLIESPPETSGEVSTLLETELADYGLDVTRVADRLADFLAVQNTYLSTFQTLGGLGLLLGTLGLGTVMLRNVLERRGELALLRAVGFRRRQLTILVLVENAFLLLWGLAAGTGSALLAMAPHLMTTGADVPWGGLQAILVGVFLIGMLAALLAVREAVRTPILATLRAE